MKARKEVYKKSLETKEEMKEKRKKGEDSTFFDEVQDIKYEDYRDELG